MKQILVTLPRSQYQYSVLIGQENLPTALMELLAKQEDENLFVVTNETVDRLYPNYIPAIIQDSFKVHQLILPDGEQYKNLSQLQRILDFLVQHRARRSSYLLALGGGVIGDMTGFAASVYMRGVDYIQIPTTLLSQVDSSIGGKTAINHAGGKNFIGAFKQPLQTIIDINFLKTLPRREFVAGYAELIKHGLIADGDLFETLSSREIDALREDEGLLAEVIGRSCRVKAQVVENDETESSQRAILNFGHTLAHFIETWTGYSKYLHGEAVIAGMDFAAWWSYRRQLLGQIEFGHIHGHLKSLHVSLEYPEVQREDFIKLVGLDKKANATGLKYIFLTGLGQSQIQEKISGEMIWEAYTQYLKSDDPLIRHDNVIVGL